MTSKETFRHAILEILCTRHPAALMVSGVMRRLIYDNMVDGPVTTVEVESALEMLRSAGLAETLPDSLGPTKYWRATAAGILSYERGQ